MTLEYDGNDCDCEECMGRCQPTFIEVLDARRFYVTFRLASTTADVQRAAQTSTMDCIDDSMDDQNCYAPCDSFEVGPIRFSDGELRRYRRAVELLRLRTPSVALQVRPITGKIPQGPCRRLLNALLTEKDLLQTKSTGKVIKAKQRRVSTTPKIFVLHDVRLAARFCADSAGMPQLLA